MRKDCDSCKHDEFGESYCDDCLCENPPTKWEAADYYEPDTNAERIRNMMDEQLAKFLADAELDIVKTVLDSVNMPYEEEDETVSAVQNEILEWLQQPVEE